MKVKKHRLVKLLENVVMLLITAAGGGAILGMPTIIFLMMTA